MRTIRPIALLILLLPTTAVAGGALPVVGYDAEVTFGSWRPLSGKDLARTLEHATLEVLTQPGLMRLTKRTGSGETDKQAEYRLQIRGHLLDEAQTHTVYLTFGPAAKSDLPSLNASDTIELTRLSRGKMLSRIEASARKAASGLIKALGPQLKRAARGRSSAPIPTVKVTQKWPWRWSDVRVPKPKMGRAGRALYSKKKKAQQAALRELTSLALSDASPRNILERCALEHRDLDARLGCLVALRPLSRTIAPTQRVVIEVFRKSHGSKLRRVRKEAIDQMRYFTGVAREQVVQAWLQDAAQGYVVKDLSGLGDIPNLDLAIARCLHSTGKNRKSVGNKGGACIKLLGPVPHERRRAILGRFLGEMDPDSPYYIRGAGKSEGSTGTPWQRAVEAVLEHATEWDPELGEILWKRYQRTLSESAIRVLAGYAPPDERAARRLIEAVQTAGHKRALQGLIRMATAAPKVRRMVLDALSEMQAMGTYPKSLRPQQLERAIKRIKKADR